MDPRSDVERVPVGLVAAVVPPSVLSFAVSAIVSDIGSAVGFAVLPAPEAAAVFSDDRDCASGLSAGPGLRPGRSGVGHHGGECDK